MSFWLFATGLTAIVTAFILRPLLRRSDDVSARKTGDLAVRLYRDQLAEVDRDLANGVLGPDEADRTRLEISRRILDADKDATNTEIRRHVSQPLRLTTVGLAVGVIVIGSFAIYHTLGAGGTADSPLKKRLAAIEVTHAAGPSQLEAEAWVKTSPPAQVSADYVALVTKLRQAAQSRPNDLQGQKLLALHEARIGNFVKARLAQAQVISLLGDNVRGKDFIDLAELMIIAANGIVSPQAEQALGKAIIMVPDDPRGRYYAGLGLWQSGRPDITLNLWRQLLSEGPDDAPWIAPIRAQITNVARAAGVAAPDLTRPAPPPGPTGQQIRDAGDLNATDRNDMIKGMVKRLSDRLTSTGGSADEWARLIRALGVLGETARASAIWNQAREIFAADPAALNTLLRAARTAEVSN